MTETASRPEPPEGVIGLEIPRGFRHRLPHHVLLPPGGGYRHCQACGHNVSLHHLSRQPWDCRFCKECPGLATDELAQMISEFLALNRNPREWIPLEVRQAVLARDGMICRYCKLRVHTRKSGPRKLHYDHVIPWSRGGPATAENIAISCRSCNISKGDRDVEEWLAARAKARKLEIAKDRIVFDFGLNEPAA